MADIFKEVDEELRHEDSDLGRTPCRSHCESQALTITPHDMVFFEFDLSRPLAVRLEEANHLRELFGAHLNRDGSGGRERDEHDTRLEHRMP